MAIFIASIVFIPSEQKTNSNLIKNVWKIFVVLQSLLKTVRFNQCQKSDKTPSIIYPDLESLIKKVDRCKNNLKKSSTRKMWEHIHCRNAMPQTWTFDGIENKPDVCRGVDCTRKFCGTLSQHAIKTNNFEKKKTIPLTSE